MSWIRRVCRLFKWARLPFDCHVQYSGADHPPYWCTQPWMHDGDHIACGEDGLEIHRWPLRSLLEAAVRRTWKTTDGLKCDHCGRVLTEHVQQIYCLPIATPEKPEAA